MKNPISTLIGVFWPLVMVGMWLYTGHAAWYYAFAILSSISLLLGMFSLGVLLMLHARGIKWRTQARKQMSVGLARFAVFFLIKSTYVGLMLGHDKYKVAGILGLDLILSLITWIWISLPPQDEYPNRLDEDTDFAGLHSRF